MRYSKNRKIPQTAITIIFSLALLFFPNAIYAEEKPKPPQQPASGPGGIKKEFGNRGRGESMKPRGRGERLKRWRDRAVE